MPKLVSMYAEMLANWISGGRLVNRDKISSLGLKPVYNQYFTKNYITKAWCIIKFPVHFDRNAQEAIRIIMHREFPTVKTIIHTVNEPVYVNTDSRVYKQLMGTATKAFDDYAFFFSQMREDEKLAGKMEVNPETGRRYFINRDTLKRIKERKESYTYVYQEVSKGKQMFSTYFFIQASSANRKVLDKYGKRLTRLLGSEDIEVRPVKGSISEYLANYCPATTMRNSVRGISSFLTSQEGLAFQMPYRNKGLVGTGGLLMGLDWQTKLPFFYNPVESSDGQVVLVDARTGWGKTYVCFNIADQGIGSGIHVSAIDFKGNEWIKMSDFVDAKVISMDSSNPVFVNTLRLDDLNCTAENAREMYSNAITGTVILLSLMVHLQANEGNSTDLNDILEKAVMKLYFRNGIIADNPDTFYRTASLNYQDVIDIVADLESTESYNEEQLKICNLIKLRCASFLSSDGRYGNLMKNEITVADILNSPLVIYSFNKNNNGELDVLDTIKVFMVQFLDSKKHEIRKSKHLHTFAFYEELQRCTNFTILLNYITSRVTGSRSSNVSVFLLTNSISALAGDAMAQIRSNITTKIIGRVSDEDRMILVEQFGCQPIENYLQLIADTKTTYYRNCFAIQYDTGFSTDKTIFKTELPDYMWEAFNTRDRMVI